MQNAKVNHDGTRTKDVHIDLEIPENGEGVYRHLPAVCQEGVGFHLLLSERWSCDHDEEIVETDLSPSAFVPDTLGLGLGHR